MITCHARRTSRLEDIAHHLGLALGGRSATRLARRLMLPASKDTLLRIVRRHTHLPSEPLSVIGIDDWAWRRNHRYGTIVGDLERRRIASLLPDREQATTQAWLASHPEIAVIARDRGGVYGEAAAKALPDAVQVADCWHLMENASRAFLEAVRTSMHPIRQAVGSATITPDLLTCAEHLQYEGHLRREETNATVMALGADGIPIKQIVRQTGLSRGTVRQNLRGCRSDVFRQRESSLAAYWPLLEALDRWMPQPGRALAAPAGERLSRFAARSGGMDDPPSRGTDGRRAASARAVRQDHCPTDPCAPCSADVKIEPVRPSP
jgi:transposase